MPQELPNLHDLLLTTIEVEWESGDLRLLIEGNKFNLIVSAKSLLRLDCTRKFDWGPSSFINGATLESNDQVESLAIEMQSGDIIRIDAKSFTFSTMDGGQQ